MKTQDNPGNLLFEALLDRLVDGELSSAERRAVLAQIEAASDGWKRCAIAFLEAQCWAESLSAITAELPSVDKPATSHKPARKPLRLAVFQGLAAAALVLVSFGLGRASEQSTGRGSSGSTEVAHALSVPTEPNLTTTETPEPKLTQTAEIPPQTEVRPAVAVNEPSLVQTLVSRELRKRGFEAEPVQQIIEVATRDGRRMAVPVQAVKLRYISDQPL